VTVVNNKPDRPGKRAVSRYSEAMQVRHGRGHRARLVGLLAAVVFCSCVLSVGGSPSRAIGREGASPTFTVSDARVAINGSSFPAVPQRVPGSVDAGAPAAFTHPTGNSGKARVTLFTAIPATVPAAGGRVRLVANVENATVCRFTSTRAKEALSAVHDCSSGATSVDVTLGRNATNSTVTYGFILSVRGRHSVATTVPVLVHVKARAKTTTKPPAITTQPRSVSLLAGQTATFTAAASGSPTPGVHWQIRTSGERTWRDISGARATSYAFVSTTGETGNEYRAVFTNSAGTATTTAATVTVTTLPANTAPAITTQPASDSVASGGDASFTAAASGNPAPSVQWQTSVNGGGSWTNVGGASATTYAFTANSGETGTEYRAVFTNSAGSATTSAATLTVTTPPANTAPAITTQPASETVANGGGASFTAGASGSPAPTVQWQLSTDGGVTWNNIGGASAATYAFTASSGETGDEYRAVFTNLVSSATTSAATLTVSAPGVGGPVITTQPTNGSGPTGASVSFSAAASGTPTPTVQWQVSTNSGVAWGNVSGATSTTYTLTAGSSENNYEYRAVFTNANGSATTNGAMLTVLSEQTSSNWSGYVATGDTFKSVGASWTVPTISCPASTTDYSSHWIGIDGDGSDTVEQDGIEADCINGSPYYGAWYEMYGDSAVARGDEVPLSPSTYPVSPGDAITASVSVAGSTWTLTISDSAWPQPFHINIVWSTPSQASAEWISERPEVGCDTCLASLADYGSASFTGSTATGAHTTGGISAFTFTPIEMENGSDLLSAPGALSGSGADFTDTWYASN
jgi:hypothetical protein